jgi:hypothetical protein
MSALIEDTAECRDLDRQIAFLDHGLGPNGGNDVVPRNEPAVPLQQDTENIERPRSDRHWYEAVVINPKETAAAPVETEILKQEDTGSSGCIHPFVPTGRKIRSEFFRQFSHKFGTFYVAFVARLPSTEV